MFALRLLAGFFDSCHEPLVLALASSEVLLLPFV